MRTDPVRIVQITDGTSKTLMVAEQSDWCYTALDNRADCRSDCGHGFAMGFPRDDWDQHYNITTVLHELNEKQWTLLGIAGNCGPNRPIQSAHPGGAHVLSADGAVRFLVETIDLQTLYNLANRDDGYEIPEI